MGAYLYTVRNEERSMRVAGMVKPDGKELRLPVRSAHFLNRHSNSHSPKVVDAMARAQLTYEKKGIARYIIRKDAGETDLTHMVVYAYDRVTATHVDDVDNLEAVGVILGSPRKWYIECRKDVVEKLTRQAQWTKMKEGRLHIGEFGKDVDAYEDWLHDQDRAARAKGEPCYFQGYHKLGNVSQ